MTSNLVEQELCDTLLFDIDLTMASLATKQFYSPLMFPSLCTRCISLSRHVREHRKVISRPFSYSPTSQSQVGRSAISIPPEVDFNCVPPPQLASDETSSRQAPVPSVLVKGPLGELRMEVPAYMNVDYNTKSRKAFLSVADPEEKKQREMWGERDN